MEAATPVKLNVGGKRFLANDSTIRSKGHNILTNLIDREKETHSCMKDEKGYLFVDRNGEVFGVILDYLRTGQLVVPPLISLRHVLMELEFYQIEPSGNLYKEAAKWRLAAKEWLNSNNNLESIQKCAQAKIRTGLGDGSSGNKIRFEIQSNNKDSPGKSGSLFYLDSSFHTQLFADSLCDLLMDSLCCKITWDWVESKHSRYTIQYGRSNFQEEPLNGKHIPERYRQ